MQYMRLILYKTRLPLPLSFAYHYFFVLKISGTDEHRVEVHRQWPAELQANKMSKQTDFVLEDYYSGNEGLPMFYLGDSRDKHWRWPGIKCETFILSNEQVNQFRNCVTNYPYRHTYHYWPGPNSNTFTKYILDQLQLDHKFPVTAVGWRYKNRS
tara:strand:- start:129 stop:593 length:465 start_codon:yes stop_codon:yes gene_type:complete